MARVNHKLVKQRMNEKFSKISDRQFFTSRLLAGHYEDIAAAQTRRFNYNRRVHVVLNWKPKEAETAWTDNNIISINCGYKLITKVRGREKRYWIVTGFFAHELGHVLYTDFLAKQTYFKYMERGNWYPEKPKFRNSKEEQNENEFWDFVNDDPQNMQLAIQLVNDIANILEDGYIENRMLVNFPGTLGIGLKACRKVHFDSILTVTQLKEEEENEDGHILGSIFQNLLSYAKFGEIKYGDEPLTDERIVTVFDLIPEVDKAILTKSAKERFSVVNTIIIRCWDYIKDYLEYMKERQASAAAVGAASDAATIISVGLSSLKGTSSIGTGATLPVSEGESEPSESSSATAAARTKTKEDSESESEEKPEDKAGLDGAAEGEDEKTESEKTPKTDPESETLELDDSTSPMPIASESSMPADEEKQEVRVFLG